ncbi:hypothetical protein NDU88_002233 [Pleurodeles waltl]|uniref:PLAT domain-containing protein n=1 Tax=Pleurodeles waltl TaxID=8319 RepID=A0AAV7M0Y7_PLEWA|nr:hypothetical protein NDU88_002233 [Pleurodeles waltl]
MYIKENYGPEIIPTNNMKTIKRNIKKQQNETPILEAIMRALKNERPPGWSVRRNFASHWAEASLRMSIGKSGEQSEKKLQTSPERQMQVQQIIKRRMSHMNFTKSATDHRTGQRTVKNKSREKKPLHSRTSAVQVSRPCVSREEFKRLVLSASKIISAITPVATLQETKNEKESIQNNEVLSVETQCSKEKTPNVSNEDISRDSPGNSNSVSLSPAIGDFSTVLTWYESIQADSDSNSAVDIKDQTNYSKQHEVSSTNTKVEEYEIIVHTGTTAYSSASAEVYVSLVGNNGRSEELLLSNSLTNSVPFGKGQTDIFKVKTEDVGQLKNCIIRQENKDKSHSLYMEDVIIKKWGSSADLYVFPCNTWLSSEVEIVLQCLPDSDLQEGSPARSMEGSTSENQSISLPVSRKSSISSSQSSRKTSPSFQQDGENSSSGSFTSRTKSLDSSSSSSTFHRKTLQYVEGITSSKGESSLSDQKNGYDLQSQNQELEVKSHTLQKSSTINNSTIKDTAAKRHSNSVPVPRPISAPPFSQEQIENYDNKSTENQTFMLTGIYSQKGRPKTGKFHKESCYVCTTTERKINCTEEVEIKINKGRKTDECVENKSTQETPLIIGETTHFAEGTEHSKRRVTCKGANAECENDILENAPVYPHHSESQHEEAIPDMTCRVSLPPYNIFLNLGRDMASCSDVSDTCSKSNSEIENTLEDSNPSPGKGTVVDDTCSDKHGIGPRNRSAASDSSRKEHINSNSDEFSLSETEEVAFSISSTSDDLHSLNSQNDDEEKMGFDEHIEYSDSTGLFYNAVNCIKTNNCQLLENLCHNNFSLLSYTDTEGRTLLHHAAAHGNVDICQVLLKDNIGRMQLDLQDIYGKTALHYAIQMHNSAVLKFLVNEEAKYDIPDQNSQTVLDHALSLIEWHVNVEGNEGSTYPPIGWLPSI